MDWGAEQQDFGAFGFAGICRETYRVLLRAIKNGGQCAASLSVLFLAHIAVNRTFLSQLDACHGVVSLIAVGLIYFISEALRVLLLLLFSLTCNEFYVFSVATIYFNGVSNRLFRGLTLEKLLLMFVSLIPIYITLSVPAWLEFPQLDASLEVVVLALQLLGGAAFLAGAAYVAVVCHIACVVAVLEDAVVFGAVRKSRSLLAGKFWAAAAVFVPLDGCFLGLEISFLKLVLDDALGLGRWFQVAAGAAMAVALWVVVVLTLVAQPVVYLVCKNHHNEAVDKVRLKPSTMSVSASGSPSTATAPWSCNQ